jgi:hypothetical protein
LGFESLFPSNTQKCTCRKAGVFLCRLLGEQCLDNSRHVGTRSSERYEASKPNRERRPARFVSDGEQILVGESLSRMYSATARSGLVAESLFIPSLLTLVLHTIVST